MVHCGWMQLSREIDSFLVNTIKLQSFPSDEQKHLCQGLSIIYGRDLS